MKKTYSDPLMFSNILLTGIVVGPSQDDSIPPYNTTKGLVVDNVGASANNDDVQIVEPEQKSEPTVTEESIQSVIEQILGEETQTPPSDESSLAD